MKRKVYYDMLRIIAALLVIFNHTPEFQYYATVENGVMRYVYMTCAIVCKVVVFVFFMISGALLLEKEETYKKLGKRILRILAVLVIFSFVVYVVELEGEISLVALNNFFKTLYSKGIRSSYWYLYAYLTFLIALPLLRKMVKNFGEKDYKYLLLLALVSSFVIPLFNKTCGIAKHSHLVFFLVGTIPWFYPIVGYYCDKILVVNKKSMVVLGSGTLISILLTIFMTENAIEETGNLLTQQWLSAFILIPSMSFFVFIKYIFEKIDLGEKVGKVICYIGGCTFGIYLLEGPLRKLYYGLIYDRVQTYIPSFLACIVGVCGIFSIALVITMILKKLPLLKNII